MTASAPSIKVLIVDDSAPIRKMLSAALELLPGCQITEAENGIDALRKIASSRFNIILSDINMPMLDGLKLVKRLRAEPSYRDIPIIMITTENAQEDRDKALGLGANAYLAKPVEPQTLIATIRSLLKL